MENNYIHKKQFEKIWGNGKWEIIRKLETSFECKCPKCQRTEIFTGRPANFCERCGAANTDEAVEIIMERLEDMT